MKWIMRVLLSVLVVLGLGACSDQGVKENHKETSPPVEQDSSEELGQDEDVEEVTSENVLAEVRDALGTEFEVKLPAEVKVTEGKNLSAMTSSSAGHYEVAFYETDEPTDINAAKLAESEPIALVKGTVYESSEEAKELIGYQIIQEGMPEVDLGYDITGYQDAGAGSSFITWHEGRWSLIVRARNDEEGNAAGLNLAKAIVEKLETQMLPIPHENGAGTFSSWDHDEVDTNRIAWQEEEVVYEVSRADPLALVDFVTEGFNK